MVVKKPSGLKKSVGFAPILVVAVPLHSLPCKQERSMSAEGLTLMRCHFIWVENAFHWPEKSAV